MTASLIVSAVILCNNLNWQHSPRCMAPVETFYQTETGFLGFLETGVFFTQTRNTDGTQTFRMEQVCWQTNGYTTWYCGDNSGL